MTDTASLSRPPLVLASSSVYRRVLLERLRLPFSTQRPDVDETPWPLELPQDTAARLALAKARAISQRQPGALVIGSDQVATFDGRQVGKPGDHQHARAQLRAMRGREVTYYTALCLIDGRNDSVQSDTAIVRVTFRDLSDDEIEQYLLAEQPYDVAGSAKCEGLGISLLERIDSDDPTALVGLPLIRLVSMLRRAAYPMYAAGTP
jgi:septum formation protein